MQLSKKISTMLVGLGLLSTSLTALVSWTYIDAAWKASSAAHDTAPSSRRHSATVRQRAHHQALRVSYIWASISLLGGVLFASLLGGILLTREFETKVFTLRHQLRARAPALFSDAEATSPPTLEALQRDLSLLLQEFEERQQNEVFKEQVARWQDVARRLAHEIRNPLTPIQLSIQELHSRYHGGDPRYQRQLDTSLEIVREEVETLRRLVEEFSSFAKLPQVQLKHTELSLVVTEFLDSYGWFQEAAQVTLERVTQETWVQLDKMLFKRALHNLLQNAIEAGSPSIHIRIGQLTETQVICQIEDRGPGIPPHLHSKIFTPYFTTKQLGTGLGLSITKKIMIDHGGTISVAPNPDGGSVFTIRLPAAPPPPKESDLI